MTPCVRRCKPTRAWVKPRQIGARQRANFGKRKARYCRKCELKRTTDRKNSTKTTMELRRQLDRGHVSMALGRGGMGVKNRWSLDNCFLAVLLRSTMFAAKRHGLML